MFTYIPILLCISSHTIHWGELRHFISFFFLGALFFNSQANFPTSNEGKELMFERNTFFSGNEHILEGKN